MLFFFINPGWKDRENKLNACLLVSRSAQGELPLTLELIMCHSDKRRLWVISGQGTVVGGGGIY